MASPIDKNNNTSQTDLFAMYSNKLRKGTTSLGNDPTSIKLFQKIDTDRNGSLSEAEANNANNNLESLLAEFENEDVSIETTPKNLDDMSDEEFELANQNKKYKNLSLACNQSIDDILKYAAEHPEDQRIQEYAADLQKILENGNLEQINGNSENDFWNGLHEKTADGLDKITLKYGYGTETLTEVLLHELGHTLSGDALDSVAEERDVEKYAREITKNIYGYSNDNSTLDEFAAYYESKGYPKYSPGYGGIPQNAGVTINWDITSVEQEGNAYIINSQKNGNTRQTKIVMSDEVDNKGNPYPTKMSETLTVKGQSPWQNCNENSQVYDKNKRKFVDINSIAQN